MRYKQLAVKLLVIALFASVAYFNIGGCGGSGGNGESGESGECTFDINTLFNGKTESTAVSVWFCMDRKSVDFQFGVFDDGTGFSTPGLLEMSGFDFTWLQIGCDSIRIMLFFGTADIIDISVMDTFLAFSIESEEVPDLDGRVIGCELLLLP